MGKDLDLKERNESIRNLIEKLREKSIRIPALQRKYVWSKTQVKNLLDSLYRGYPTGTLLMWESDKPVNLRETAVSTGETAGSQNSQSTTPLELLLLDGQQRLTSLLALATGKKVKVKGRKRPIDILFNLNHPEDEGEEEGDPEEANSLSLEEEGEDEEGDEESENSPDDSESKTFVVATNKLAGKEGWVPVTKVFKEMVLDGKDPLVILDEAGIKTASPNFSRSLTRLNKLGRIVDTKYYTQVVPSTASYAEATEIFARVNSGGSKLRKSDLALALMTVKWREAVDEIEAFEVACAKEYKIRSGSDLYVRNLITFATDPHRCGFDQVRDISKERMCDSWNPSKMGMEFALRFLADRVGSEFPALLSSPFPLITIANYASEKEDIFSDEERDLLRFWCIAADMKGRYTRGATETALDDDLKAVRKGDGAKSLVEMLEQRVGSLGVRPAELMTTRRGPHLGAMFLAFREDGAEDWTKSLRIELSARKKSYAFEVHHIFPKAVLEGHTLKDGKTITDVQINTICNLAFVTAKTNKAIRDKKPEDYLPTFIEMPHNKGSVEFLEKQCVPTDPRLWKVENYEEFLEERRKQVIARLDRFLADPRPKKPEEG